MRTWEQASAGDLLRGEVISLILLDHPQLEEFLFHPSEARLRETPDQILKLSKSFSSGEQVLLRVALDIWSGTGDAKVSHLLRVLDEQSLVNVLNGLRFLVDRN